MAQIDIMKRDNFWRYCVETAGRMKCYCASKGLPYAIDKYFIDELFVRQSFKCAVSGIQFEQPRSGTGKNPRHPFGPSLDRIKPPLGYVPSNVRLVCTMVNLAMSDWGEDNLRRLVSAMSAVEYSENKSLVTV